MLSAIVNDAEMQRVPMLLGEQFFQVRFRLLHIPAAGEFPALRESVNVRVDRERRNTECLSQDHTRRFVTYSRQFLQFLEGPRHLTTVLRDEQR